MASKKKSISCNFIIPLVVYPFDVMVSIGQDNDQLGRILDRYHLSENDILLCQYTSDTCRGRSALFSTNQSFIRLRKLPETPYEYGVLAHEVFHVVTFIMDRIGMKLLILESDEAYAYLVGYLTEQMYKRINRYC